MRMGTQKFDRMKNGYNRFQVDDYIAQQQSECLMAKKESAFFQEELVKLKQSYDLLSQEYAGLQENLKIREQAASDMTLIAMKEANVIVETAHQNADAIIVEALTQARGILMEITRLGNQTNDLKKSMKDELKRLEEALNELQTPQVPGVSYLNKENS